MNKQVVVAVTGASGALYAKRLIECLVDGAAQVHLVASPHGKQLFRDELGIDDFTTSAILGRPDNRVMVYSHSDVGCKLASGSFLTDGMIVCPASSNTVGAIASGLGGNLIERAAQVTLKEARRLIVVPREMPFNRIELKNLLRIANAGGIVCPAAPGFYMLPQSIGELVDFVVGKLLDLLGMPHKLDTRWQASPNLNTTPEK